MISFEEKPVLNNVPTLCDPYVCGFLEGLFCACTHEKQQTSNMRNLFGDAGVDIGRSARLVCGGGGNDEELQEARRRRQEERPERC